MKNLFWIATASATSHAEADAAMNTAHRAAWLEHTFTSTGHVSSLFWRYWGGFQERRERRRLRAALYDLNDRELRDIGITRGEVDYVASNRSFDPRGVPSMPPANV